MSEFIAFVAYFRTDNTCEVVPEYYVQNDAGKDSIVYWIEDTPEPPKQDDKHPDTKSGQAEK